jgi:hypothetical protein
MGRKKGSPRDYTAGIDCSKQPTQKSRLGEPHECYSLYRIGRTQENHQLLHQDGSRPDRIVREIAVELHVSPLDPGFENLGRRIVRIVNFQIRPGVRVCLDNLVDEALVGRETPRRARAQAHSRVLAACNELRRALAVSGPVELATHVNKAFQPHIRAIEDGTNDRIVVVELRIRGDDNPWLYGRASLPMIGHGDRYEPNRRQNIKPKVLRLRMGQT